MQQSETTSTARRGWTDDRAAMLPLAMELNSDEPRAGGVFLVAGFFAFFNVPLLFFFLRQRIRL